jgi:hypothetical protein
MGRHVREQRGYLAEVDACTNEVMKDLREQQTIVPQIDNQRLHTPLLKMLSNALWILRRLEDQREAIIEHLAEFLPSKED